MSAVRIGVLFPTTFNLNGDAANAPILARRFALSGIDAEVVPLDFDALLTTNGLDALIIGSPSSSSLESPEVSSSTTRDFVADILTSGIPVLAISNGFHLLGRIRHTDGSKLGGLDLINVETELGGRHVVTIGAQLETPWGAVVGVENHNANVSLPDGITPFGRVMNGVGNGTNDSDGFVEGSVWGTHLHGPLFALNSSLADEFAARVATNSGQIYVPGPEMERIDRLARVAREHLVRKITS